jgi:hypothetical protein
MMLWGHSWAQVPQEIHFSGSIQYWLPWKVMASTGQFVAQLWQQTQRSTILYAIIGTSILSM